MDDNPYEPPQATESHAPATCRPPLQFFLILKWFAVAASIQFVFAIVIHTLSPNGSVAQYWANEVAREGAGLAFTLCVVYFIMKMRRWRADKPMAEGAKTILPFVDDGHERATEAIRAEVEAKFAQQLTAASAAEKKLLKKKIEAEIRDRIKAIAPPDALY